MDVFRSHSNSSSVSRADAPSTPGLESLLWLFLVKLGRATNYPGIRRKIPKAAVTPVARILQGALLLSGTSISSFLYCSFQYSGYRREGCLPAAIFFGYNGYT